jgi:hypothetical protein
MLSTVFEIKGTEWRVFLAVPAQILITCDMACYRSLSISNGSNSLVSREILTVVGVKSDLAPHAYIVALDAERPSTSATCVHNHTR